MSKKNEKKRHQLIHFAKQRKEKKTYKLGKVFLREFPVRVDKSSGVSAWLAAYINHLSLSLSLSSTRTRSYAYAIRTLN